MFGAFRQTAVASGGLLWYVNELEMLQRIDQTFRKSPWRLSPTRKANQRKRMKMVDSVIDAVRESGVECAALVCPSLGV